MSIIKEFLKSIKVDNDTIDNLLSDEPKEGFDAKKSGEKYRSVHEELVLSKSKDKIIEAYEKEEGGKRYAATIKPIISALKKTGEFTEEEIASFKDNEDGMVNPKKA